MKGFKGFSKGLICRGKQYAENTVFEEESAVVCESGMHFCENPFDVLDYYGFIDNNGEFNEFAGVEALDEPVTDDGKKFSSKKLKVGAKIGIKGLIDSFIEFVFEKSEINSGCGAKLASSGDGAQLASSGDRAQLASSGDCAQLASSGDRAKLASSGDRAQLASSGNWAQLASSGNWAKLASSGDGAQLASSGDRAKLASSGDRAKLASSGCGAKLASSGDCAQLASSGENSVICCAGIGGIAKASKGSWITLSEWEFVNDKYVPVCVKTVQVDGEAIKADTYYKLSGGEFIAQEDTE